MSARLQRRFSFVLPDAAAEWAGAALSDVFPDGLLLHPLHGGVTRLEGWQAGRRSGEAALIRRLRSLGATRVQSAVPKAPKRALALDGRFPVQQLGRFRIVPAALAARTPKKKAERRIVLVQGQAFGTGLHESTRLMLGQLERLKPAGLAVLDVGAGSGILGFACLHLGAQRVTCVEIESAACAELRENRALNRVPPSALPVLGGAYPLARLRGRRYPLVLGNLVTPLLAALMPRLAAQVARGGRLLCSGIHTSSEAAQVSAAARARGLKLERRATLHRWQVLSFVKA